MDVRLSTFEEVEARATQWKLHTSQLEKGVYRAVLQGIHTPSLQLARTWRRLSSHVAGEVPRGTIILGFSAILDSRLSFRGRSLRADEVVLQRDSSQLDLSLSGVSDMVSLAVDAEEMDRRAEHLWHRRFASETGTLAFESPEAAHRAAVLSLATIRENLTPDGRLADPVAARALENRILDRILCSLKDRTPAVGTLGRHLGARKAAGILRERCAEDVSITDLCEATGANRRTLHLGFLELYGVPPMQFLKALRLCRIRRDLSKMRDCGERVTDIATRWGFCHLGRFAASYRDFFGELPSTQKARANPRPVPSRLYD